MSDNGNPIQVFNVYDDSLTVVCNPGVATLALQGGGNYLSITYPPHPVDGQRLTVLPQGPMMYPSFTTSDGNFGTKSLPSFQPFVPYVSVFNAATKTWF